MVNRNIHPAEKRGEERGVGVFTCGEGLQSPAHPEFQMTLRTLLSARTDRDQLLFHIMSAFYGHLTL